MAERKQDRESDGKSKRESRFRMEIIQKSKDASVSLRKTKTES